MSKQQNVGSKSARRETGLTLRQASALRKLTSARQRLNKAIEHALEAGITRWEFLRSIDAAIRLSGWIFRALGLGGPKLVCSEMVMRAADDIDWMAAELERLFADPVATDGSFPTKGITQ